MKQSALKIILAYTGIILIAMSAAACKHNTVGQDKKNTCICNEKAESSEDVTPSELINVHLADFFR